MVDEKVTEFALGFIQALHKMKLASDVNMPVTLTDEENKAVIRALQLMKGRNRGR